MGSKILFVTATTAEAEVIGKIKGIIKDGSLFSFGEHKIDVLVSGVGGISTSWSLNHWFGCNTRPDLVINTGIAGSYNPCYKPGDVVMPVEDCFADEGIEYSDNEFSTLFEAGFRGKNDYPFKDGWINADMKPFKELNKFLPFVKAATVNTASGSATSIARIKNKFNPDIETMEGATFFYICAMERIPFLAIRAVSNIVEPRDKSRWNIPLALNNLATKLEDILLVLK